MVNRPITVLCNFRDNLIIIVCLSLIVIYLQMLKVRLVSDLLDIKTVDEMGRDVEHIGIITKLILRRIIPIHAKKYGNENGGK